MVYALGKNTKEALKNAKADYGDRVINVKWLRAFRKREDEIRTYRIIFKEEGVVTKRDLREMKTSKKRPKIVKIS